MGKRGPKPEPKALLALRGSRAGIPGADDCIATGTPEAPLWLDPIALACWQDTLPKLLEMGVLGRIDGNALARYCVLWSRWRNAEQFLAENGSGYTLKNDDGSPKYHAQYPEVAIANQLSIQLTKIEAEFGMTPSSRSRIVVAPSAKPKNAIMEFLRT